MAETEQFTLELNVEENSFEYSTNMPPSVLNFWLDVLKQKVLEEVLNPEED